MTVLACIDGSRFTESVCAYAARSARRLGIGVELLHAIDRLPGEGMAIDRSGRMTFDMADTALEEFSRLNEERSRFAQAQGRLILDQAESLIRSAGIEHVQERLVFGGLIDAIHAREVGAQLIVIGKRGEAESQATAHIGSNLERVVRSVHHPVLIVPLEQRPFRRFVVAFDGGPSSARVLDTLTRGPLLLEAECHLLSVGSGAELGDQLTAAALRLRNAGYAVNELMKPGHADDVIISTVQETDSDLLVMGAYGHSRIRALIIGSTTTSLLRASTIPVLVIR